MKLFVRETGLYRLDAADLQAAGFPLAAVEEGRVRLTEGGEDVPVLFVGNGLVFYGRASTNRYTSERVYILSANRQGVTMGAEPVRPPDSESEPATLRRTVHLEQNLEYVSEAAASSEDPWFWHTIGFQSQEPIQLSLEGVTQGSGSLSIRLYGVSHNAAVDPDHNLELILNGANLVVLSWDGQTPYTATVDIPPGSLVPGSNTLNIQNQSQDFLDISKLDWVTIDYVSEPRAKDNYLAFRSGGGNLVIEGFDAPPVLVNVSDPLVPTRLTGWTFEEGSARLAMKQAGSYVAAAADGFLQPVRVAPLRSSELTDAGQQADLLIVTTEALAGELAPLVKQRQEQGLTVALVKVEDIYDSFGHGAPTPDSINEFVRFAYHQWQKPAPRYLLIVGAATSDYWDFLSADAGRANRRPANNVPPYMTPVRFGGETVSDARLADVEGDVRPELAVGRWPVDTTSDVRALVQRTLAYERSTASDHTLFAIDPSNSEFRRLSEHLLSASNLPTETSTLLVGPSTGELGATWNEGAWLVSYVGHGSLQLWGKDAILSTDTADSFFQEGSTPIVVQLTCLTGLFAHPEITSLSEVMLTHPHGPVIVIGATSLTLSTHQQPFALALLSALQNHDVERVGDAFHLATTALDVNTVGLREISDTFVLLGDPSARIVRP